MKIKVYDPAESKSTFLKIENNNYGVDLIVCDENGSKVSAGRILRITHEGELERFSYINKGLGLKLDKNARIIMV